MPARKAPESEFLVYCLELLSSIGPCHGIPMFGGFGIRTSDGRNVALIADLGDGDTLWLKADTESRATFEAAGCQRFTYQFKNGRVGSLGYYSVPGDAMDSPVLMAPWARLALAAALRKPVGKTRRPAAKKKARTK